MRSSRTSATLAALALAASAGAAIAADAPVSDPQAQPSTEIATQADSRRVVRDKVSGKLRAPTTEEAAAMRASERGARSARGLAGAGARNGPVRVVQHGGGMRSAVLGTEYLVTLKAQRRADGSLDITHNQPGLEHPASRDVRPTE